MKESKQIRVIIKAMIEEYQLRHPMQTFGEYIERRAAIRGLAVRLDIKAEFLHALKEKEAFNETDKGPSNQGDDE